MKKSVIVNCTIPNSLTPQNFIDIFTPRFNAIQKKRSNLRNAIDIVESKQELSQSQVVFWNSQLSKYDVWLRKLNRSFMNQKQDKKNGGFFTRGAKLLVRAPIGEGEVGWYQVRGKAPALATRSNEEWSGMCKIYDYVEKSLSKDIRNFQMRGCGKLGRSKCRSPCQKTGLSGCHYEEASVQPAYQLS